MLITESLKINITNKNKNYYINKGYDIIDKGEYLIDIKDLNINSHIEIEAKCCICNTLKKMRYSDYNKITNNNTTGYYCKNCKNIKAESTNLKLYGVKNVFQSELIKEQIKETHMLNLGVDSPMKSEEVRNKSKKTNLEKLGVEYPTQNKDVIKKQKATNKLKYDCEFSLNNSEIIKKSNETKMLKFGTLDIFKLDEIQNKITKTRLVSLNKKFPKFNFVDNKNGSYYIKCDNNQDHEFEILPDLFRNRVLDKTIICTICNPVNSFSTSGAELDFKNYIETIYSGEIIFNNRNIIKPYEIDIYLPELSIAFEFNGVFWHNEYNKTKLYHKQKSDKLKMLNIQLIHIWEDDWKYKKNIIKSIIKNKINKIDNKIYARKCIIKEITDIDLVKNFLNENHLQGYVASKIKLGLYYNNELISLMTFGKNRKVVGHKNIENNYELIRFCNKLHLNVIGGASKLFKFFINTYNPNEILSYASKDISNGDLYLKLGFSYIKETEPNYYYVINEIRCHRFNYRKDLLVKQGFESTKTEVQIMHERGFYRVFDSGSYLFIYKNKTE